jgi:hypothetical protein
MSVPTGSEDECPPAEACVMSPKRCPTWTRLCTCRTEAVFPPADLVARAQDTLGGAQGGRTAYIQADLREPERILTHPKVRELLDFDRPIALLLVAVLHFFPDEDEPGPMVRTLVDALPAGSHVVASHVSPEDDPEGVARLVTPR